jgi:hypothetical protein
MCHTAYTKIQHFIHVCSGTDKTAADLMILGGGVPKHIKYCGLHLVFSGLNSHLLSEAECREI